MKIIYSQKVIEKISNYGYRDGSGYYDIGHHHYYSNDADNFVEKLWIMAKDYQIHEENTTIKGRNSGQIHSKMFPKDLEYYGIAKGRYEKNLETNEEKVSFAVNPIYREHPMIVATAKKLIQQRYPHSEVVEFNL